MSAVEAHHLPQSAAARCSGESEETRWSSFFPLAPTCWQPTRVTKPQLSLTQSESGGLRALLRATNRVPNPLRVFPRACDQEFLMWDRWSRFGDPREGVWLANLVHRGVGFAWWL
jgi:hypothetical protein